MRFRLPAVFLCMCALAVFPATAAAGLKRGIYDCKGTSSGYVNSVKIMAGGKYVWAANRRGKQLRAKTTSGTYRVRGDRIKWLSGTYKRRNYTSTIYPRGYFSLDRAKDGVWTGISCYRQDF